MDGDAILGQLREADETTLRFGAWGFGGRQEPSASAAYLSDLLGHATLADAVPEEVRLSFERVRTLFLYGLLEYDLFTAAYSLGHLVLEVALRACFASCYDGEIPMVRDGVADVLTAPDFTHYYEALRTARKRGQKLRLDHDPTEPVPRGYAELYEWARRRGLLVGQRNVGVFGSIVRLRNYIAHPEGHSVNMPPNVFRFLRDVAEIINRLWGQDTEGGRLFPTPIARWVRAAAISPERTASLTFGTVASVRSETDRHDWTYGVFLAAHDEELISTDATDPGHLRFTHIPGFQMTNYPASSLWGPGSWKELLATLDAFSDEKPIDHVPFLDRVFYVRLSTVEKPEYPRGGSDVLACDLADESVTWYVIRADFPADAYVYVRDRDEASGVGEGPATLIQRLAGDAAARADARTSPGHRVSP